MSEPEREATTGPHRGAPADPGDHQGAERSAVDDRAADGRSAEDHVAAETDREPRRRLATRTAEGDVATAIPAAGTDPDADRRTVVGRQKAAYGGMKFGSDFFGWLTATGTAVLLTALVAAAGAAIGLGNNLQPEDAARNPQTVGFAGGIALLVVLFIAYFVGGYVAGRMARFNGLKQGLGVWLWAVLIAIVVAVVGLVAGVKFDILARINSFPRLPINEGALTTAGAITAVGLAVVSLLGALLGGLAGMRYHRKIDQAGFDPNSEPGQRHSASSDPES